MADILAPGRGRVEIAALYAAYSKACVASARARPSLAGEFPAALAALCNTLNIKIEATDTGVYLLKVGVRPQRRVPVPDFQAAQGAGAPELFAISRILDWRCRPRTSGRFRRVPAVEG